MSKEFPVGTSATARFHVVSALTESKIVCQNQKFLVDNLWAQEHYKRSVHYFESLLVSFDSFHMGISWKDAPCHDLQDCYGFQANIGGFRKLTFHRNRGVMVPSHIPKGTSMCIQGVNNEFSILSNNF